MQEKTSGAATGSTSASPQHEEALRSTIPISPASSGHVDNNRKISDLSVADLQAFIASEVGRAVGRVGGGLAQGGSHVNSGPPGFVNGGGHANFDPHATRGTLGGVANPGMRPEHVNSGPPGFVNGGGHANFDPYTTPGTLGRVANPGMRPEHVNSGPPGFVNGGGHANFDPSSKLGDVAQRQSLNVTLPGGVKVTIPATGPVDMHVRGVHITR